MTTQTITLFIIGSLIIVSAIIAGYLLYLIYLARKSIFWPSSEAKIIYCKISVVLTGRDNPNNNWSMHWGYTYKVGTEEFRGKRYFFGSTIGGIPTKQMIKMEDKFKQNEKISIYYHPENPKISTAVIGVHKNLKIAIAISSFIFFFLIMIFINVLNK